MKRRVFLWGKNPAGWTDDNPPQKWGPPLWQELHSRPGPGAFNRRGEFDWLVDNFAPRIPCPRCREHFLKHLLAHPLPGTAEEYAAWLIEYHNVVNADLGKPRWAPGKNPQ